MTEARVDPIVEETLARLGLAGPHADAVRRNLGVTAPDAAVERLDALLGGDQAPPAEPAARRSPLSEAAVAPPPPPLFDVTSAVAEFRRDLAHLRHVIGSDPSSAGRAPRPAADGMPRMARPTSPSPEVPHILQRAARRAAARAGAEAAAKAAEAAEAATGADADAAPEADPDRKVYSPSPTLKRFHSSTALVRCILGPVGSGKSSGCALEILMCALRVPPIGEERVRHSRWLVARATFSELKSTTIKTFMYWLGRYGTITYGSPITYTARQLLPDGTTMLLEVEFLPLDGEDAVARLRSLELTGAWLNEASLLDANHIVEIIGRLRFRSGDYPRDKQPWRGIIIDSNMPSTRHWLYEVFELNKPDNFELFRQPPALIKHTDGTYIPNPEAENVDRLPGGFQYYMNMVNSADEKMKQKIRVLVLAEYGSVYDGKPIYDSMWRQQQHVAQSPIAPIRHQLLVVGLDFGLNPAAVFVQQGPMGGLVVLDECAPSDITFQDFIAQHLRPKLADRFLGMSILCVGDPAGVSRSALSTRTAYQLLHQAGLAAVPSFTNTFQVRRDAVGYFLNRVGGFTVDKRCSVLIDGFDGGYRYKKVSSGYSEEADKSGPFSHVHDALQYASCYFYKPQAFAPRASTRSNGVTVAASSSFDDSAEAIAKRAVVKPAANFYL